MKNLKIKNRLIFISVCFIILLFVFQKYNYSDTGWVVVPSGTTDILYGVSFSALNNGFICGEAGRIYHSSDGGALWIQQSSNLLYWLGAITAVDLNNAVSVGYQGKILRTTNGGQTWMNPYNNNSTYLYSVSFANANTNTGLTVGYVGMILLTTNGGSNWTQITGQGVSLYAVEYLSSTKAMIVGSGGKMLLSTDAGFTWANLSSNTYSDLDGISFVDENTGYVVGLNGTILKTTSGGYSWDIQNSNIITGLTGVSFTNANTGTAVGYSAVILRTTNGGANWYQQSCPVSNITLFSVFFTSVNNGVCCGGYGTILRTTTGGDPIGIKQNNNEIVSNFSLYQNYPNPFNPTTKIKFDIPQLPLIKGAGGMDVHLTICDLLGREVATLVNEKLPPGTYEVEWNGSNYTSGIYFYTLKTESYSETKKLILIK